MNIVPDLHRLDAPKPCETVAAMFLHALAHEHGSILASHPDVQRQLEVYVPLRYSLQLPRQAAAAAIGAGEEGVASAALELPQLMDALLRGPPAFLLR